MFAKLGRIAAVLMLVFGVVRVALGLYVASIEPREAREAAQARYMGSQTSGQVINTGIYTILFAIAFGVLASISRKRSDEN